jgi:hypothetical protein
MNSSSLTFSQSNYELNINLPATLATGNSASVVITYAGSPPQAEGAFTRGTHSGTPVIFTLSEPYGARDWWPCKQDLNDKVNSIDVYITAPSAYVSVSNGIEVSQTISGANKTTHFHHGYPIPAYLIAIAVTNYQIYNQQGGLGTVASFCERVQHGSDHGDAGVLCMDSFGIHLAGPCIHNVNLVGFAKAHVNLVCVTQLDLCGFYRCMKLEQNWWWHELAGNCLALCIYDKRVLGFQFCVSKHGVPFLFGWRAIIEKRVVSRITAWRPH